MQTSSSDTVDGHDDLLPCPFCGSMCVELNYSDCILNEGPYWVSCRMCGGSGGADCCSPWHAVKSWNKRHDTKDKADAILEYIILLGYVLTVKRTNTPEWMQGLARAINEWAENTGECDRVATHSDGLQIITPQDVSETMPDCRHNVKDNRAEKRHARKQDR